MALALLVVCAGLACSRAAPPIVILISLDGWRYDYIERANVPAIKALADAGVRSEGLIPSFPSKTFPNHYTIVTGLRPERHGIVANTMDDPSIGPDRFTMSAATAKDPRWWGGEPLWVTAERQGQRTASMFWPGAEVTGRQPTYWKPYDDNYPHRDRINQVLDWLRLPDADRPAFITLYFSLVDTVGHRQGPESQAVLDACAELDGEIAALVKGISALGLDDRVHYVLVSDHGMAQLSRDRVIVLDDYLDMATVQTIDGSPIMGLSPRPGTSQTVDGILAALENRHPGLGVYRREDIPEPLHYRDNPRIPPVLTIAADGWTIATRAQVDSWSADRMFGGNHGYDSTFTSMQGLFIASGPQFQRGIVIPPLDNIHLYEMMARVLGLTPAPNQGSREGTAAVFRE